MKKKTITPNTKALTAAVTLALTLGSTAAIGKETGSSGPKPNTPTKPKFSVHGQVSNYGQEASRIKNLA